MDQETDRPRVRFSLRWKIILPFIFLALVLGLGITLVVGQLFSQSEEVSFLRQLRDGGQQAADEVVRIEERLLEIERAIANTEGIPEAVALSDAEDLRSRVLQLVLSAREDVAVVLDREGTSLLAVRRSRPDAPPSEYEALRGEGYYQDWPFVRQILQLDPISSSTDGNLADKQAGLHGIVLGEDEEFVFFVGGPLIDEQETVFGAVLVGRYSANMVRDLSEVAGARITLYDVDTGQVLSTVFDRSSPWNPSGLALQSNLIEAAREPEADQDPFRTIEVAQQTYGEVLTPFLVRGGSLELGIFGISLLGGEDPEMLARNIQERANTVIRFGALALILVVVTGLLISSSITRPLVDIADASTKVADGNLDTYIPERGRDELAVLARTFNRMLDGIREDTLHRDLMGRSVTPQVRDELRKTLAMGEGLFEGRKVKATILFANLRGFSGRGDDAQPSVVLQALNETFAGVVPIVSQHGGVVQKFDGQMFLAFFGILPKEIPPQISALQATHGGMEVLEYIYRLNERRVAVGKSAIDVGIGISTGIVIAGGLGGQDRMHYTVVGQAVDQAAQVQQVTLEMGASTLLVSDHTYEYLENVRSQFEFGRYGRKEQPDSSKQMMVYEITGRTTKLVDFSEWEPEETSVIEDEPVEDTE